ncbi:sensor histidine kinase [Roseateles cellulosilyticus]|uniref:Histidine kinase n=1 Tax=Pelomonas cellulosilytica TaxID=2906762 RepID=A0ABS8XZT7_9BURK|nr:histidine kinase [Pelomonas sp. P8]MCE4558114.1 histidine kinase [Pelomonas sp. P8]
MTTGRRTALQAMVWSGYVAISLGMLASYQPVSGPFVFVMAALGALLWGATEGLRAVALRRAWLDGSTRLLLLRLALWPPLMALAVQAALYALNTAGIALGLLSFPASMPRGWGVLLGYTANTAIMLWLWMSVWLGVQTLNRWRLGEIAKWRAETAARELELQVLRAQINPHFLFNALNNLRALINEDPARAREMLSRLSNTLRHTLQHSAKERVPLADELAVVRDYVALEQLHHEERLRVAWQVDPATQGTSVPPMLLQLLVENAIKHGVARTPGGGVVDIRIARAGDRLRIAVDNPGHWKPEPGAPTSTGLGLGHLRERLARAGGKGADCRIDAADGRVTVSVEMAA